MSSPEGLRALFIYYRVSQTRTAEALHAVITMQEALMQRWPGLQARLWRRTDEVASPAVEQTCMEVYEHPAGVDVLFEQMLAEQVHMLPPGLIGPRHVESFVPMGLSPAVLGQPPSTSKG